MVWMNNHIPKTSTHTTSINIKYSNKCTDGVEWMSSRFETVENGFLYVFLYVKTLVYLDIIVETIEYFRTLDK